MSVCHSVMDKEANTAGPQGSSELPDNSVRDDDDIGLLSFVHDGLFFIKPPPEMVGGRDPVEVLKSVRDAGMQEGDVIIAAYPKCGTHWVWEVLEMLTAGKAEYNKDIKETRMMEFLYKDGVEAVPPPRIFNSHLPLRMLPKQVLEKKTKIVQVVRNPKDVVVSLYNHLRDLVAPMGYSGTFQQFCAQFLSGRVPFGSYHHYLLDWSAELADNPGIPVLCIEYEDMKKDPICAIKSMAEFLGVEADDKLVQEIADACSFQKLKMADKEVKQQMPIDFWKEGSAKTFYRKGEIGDWKNWLTVAEDEKFDEIWNEKMKNAGFHFTYTPS